VTPGGGERVEGATAHARGSFAQAWACAVAGTSYVAWGPAELAGYLLGLTDRLVDLLVADDFDTAPAVQVGADLVAAHFTGTETLSRSLVVLREGLPPLVRGCAPTDLTSRLTRAMGALAGGYAAALRERALDEQDEIRRAMFEAHRQAERRLAVSEARFHTMFTEAAIGIAIGDLGGNITEANPALLKMFGYTAEEFTRRNVSEMVHPDDAPSVWQSYEELVAGRRDHFRVEKRFFRADGGVIWTHLTVSLVRDEAGAPAYQVAMLEDITERHRLQSELEHLAYHDPLTGLPNRALLSKRLAEIFSRPRTNHRIGLCFMDLDGFKAVNDSQGHDVGDQLLRAVATLLDRCCGPGQLVARMGGDEFVILIDSTTTLSQVVTLAEKILAAVALPVRLGGHELTVTASIGIVEQPVAATTPADLMSAADITLYWAKRRGKGRYEVFDRDRVEDEIAGYTLSATMPAAIERNEFFVDYQPLVSLADEALCGVEALVRWQHPTYGLLTPNRFIGLAEETGGIVPLGGWVLATACAQARQWRDQFGESAPFVSVNLAPRQLQEPGLVSEVAAILADTGLPPRQLQLELTEQAVMSDEPGPLQALGALNEIGVRLAIDDFGTGYSNLSYLRRLPVHALKLDGSFAEGLRRADSPNATDEQIVSALVTLAHALDLTVTAEGVETATQLQRLRALGCDTGQGWYLARPGPPQQISAMMRRGCSSVYADATTNHACSHQSS
jgi:diguanylate cyclase (GGDEF)-like protein/PAS domain S-box-containing protein